MSIKKTIVILAVSMLFAGCSSNSSRNNTNNSGSALNQISGDNMPGFNVAAQRSVSYSIGINGENAEFISDDIIQVPLTLNGEEGCEKVGVRIFIDGILQDFTPDNSENWLNHNIMSVKTDDSDYELKVKAKFDKNIETHKISALSVYNPEFSPKVGMSLGNNHKAAAGAFRTLPTSGTQLNYVDNSTICKAADPSAITKEQSEKYNLKGEYDEALLLLQNDGNTYTLNETGSGVSLQFIAGTQTAGSEKYRVSFYKNHEPVQFNGNHSYLDVSLEGGKISITNIEIADVKDGDFLYCIAVPTASHNEFAYPKKTDTVVVTKGE